MILLLLVIFFRHPVELVTLAGVCESCCVSTLFAGCFMEVSVEIEGVFAESVLLYRRLILRYIAHILDIWTMSRQSYGFSSLQRFLPRSFCYD